jgi:hypothetical protein
MNITTQNFNVPLQTVVNPQTDNLRRENQQREIIAKPEAANQSAAEKGAASEKERARSPGQNSEQVDFANLRKQAEQESDSINDSSQNSGRNSDESSQENSGKRDEQSPDGQSTENIEQEGTQTDAEKDSAQIFAEQKQLKSLKQRDQEVRSHELAHASVGGAFTGSPSYSFEVGPDGKKYATGGEVSVDLSPIEGNPRATIAKMQKVHAAALAPANPSVQDTRVAASAARVIAQAQSDLSAIALDDSDFKSEIDGSGKTTDVLADDVESNEASQEFDQFLAQTLSAQAQVSNSRELEIDQRAGRIEQFYSNINQAYEKPPSFQFELTA